MKHLLSRRSFIGATALGAAALMSGCTAARRAINVLYTNLNDGRTNLNAVRGFRRNVDGSLALIGNFLTNGTGLRNNAEEVPTDASESQLIVSPDHRFLFTVNQGSNTIAVFEISRDGMLTHVPGSPFASGGIQPVSLGLSGEFLVVVHKNDEPGQRPSPANGSNYTVHRVSSEGVLSPVVGSTITVPNGSSPTQALISNNGSFLFGADLLAQTLTPPQGQLRSFRINANGTLNNIGTPLVVPQTGNPPIVLGMAQHPAQNVVYVGITIGGLLGVYTYDNNGALTFVRTVANTGAAICWMTLNRTGSRIYTINTADKSVSVYDSSNPTNPNEIQKLVLKETGPIFTLPLAPGVSVPSATSGSFNTALSPDGRYLYVIAHHINPAHPTYGAGNFLGDFVHVLNVADDGRITEPGNPVNLAVPIDSHAQGIVVL